MKWSELVGWIIEKQCSVLDIQENWFWLAQVPLVTSKQHKLTPKSTTHTDTFVWWNDAPIYNKIETK